MLTNTVQIALKNAATQAQAHLVKQQGERYKIEDLQKVFEGWLVESIDLLANEAFDFCFKHDGFNKHKFNEILEAFPSDVVDFDSVNAECEKFGFYLVEMDDGSLTICDQRTGDPQRTVIGLSEIADVLDELVDEQSRHHDLYGYCDPYDNWQRDFDRHLDRAAALCI